MAAHAGLSHALFTSNPYLLGLSTSDRAGCAVRCAAELFLNALESNATEVRVEVRMLFFSSPSFESKCTGALRDEGDFPAASAKRSTKAAKAPSARCHNEAFTAE